MGEAAAFLASSALIGTILGDLRVRPPLRLPPF
jgi:hypothetical protein